MSRQIPEGEAQPPPPSPSGMVEGVVLVGKDLRVVRGGGPSDRRIHHAS